MQRLEARIFWISCAKNYEDRLLSWPNPLEEKKKHLFFAKSTKQNE